MMGISIYAVDGPDIPRHIVVDLECDATTEMFCRGVESFMHPDGFVGSHADAMVKCWLERQTSQGRLWLCPQCSGKRT